MSGAAGGEGQEAARRVLERLLRRAESARLRGEAEPASLSMAGNRDAAEYRALRGLDGFEAFHARIALAEREGAVAAERDAHRGDGQKLLRLRVTGMEALARHLGVRLLAERAAQAAALLEPWMPRFPIVVEVLDAWRNDRRVRGHDADAAVELADAAHAVAARTDDAGHERILRRESWRLFGDSKRLEKLTSWLDLLVTGELVAGGLEQEQVWSALGLRREPQPMLIAGAGTVELEDGPLPLRRPYLGLPAEMLRGVETRATRLLTVENLASFHDAARAASADPALLLLYTGGMPSPVWRRAYVRILGGLPAAARLYHWGDIDEGGFRIAAVLAEEAQAAGHELRPWRMSPDELPTSLFAAAQTPDVATLAAMRYWAGRAGWTVVAQGLSRHPLRLEQESLEPLLPP